MPFKKGFYTVDIKYFVLVTLDFFIPKRPCGVHIITVKGLVLFDKKVVLFGSEGGIRIFKSTDSDCINLCHPKGSQDNLPIAKVEVAEPIALTAKITECCDHRDERSLESLPQNLVEHLGDDKIEEQLQKCEISDECHQCITKKKVLASVGIFSIIKMVRYVQLLVPAFDFCIPNKTCIASTDEEPCTIFDTIDFPVDEFFPPQICDFPGAADEEHKMRS